jgi:hypothetical protein
MTHATHQQREPSAQTAHRSIWPRVQPKLMVGAPGDRLETEADRAADAVVDGAPVRIGPASAGTVRRQPPAAPPAAGGYSEGLQKLGEAFLKTQVGKQLVETAERLGSDFIATLPGKIITGTAAVAAVAELAREHRALPAQPPAIPLDFVTPGLKAQLRVEGPIDHPSAASISFSVPLGRPAAPPSAARPPSGSAAYRAETERMRGELEKWRPRTADDQAMDAYTQQRLQQATERLIPGLRPRPAAATPPEKKEEEGAVRRKAVSGGDVGSFAAPAGVEEVLAAGGEKLPPDVESRMSARFGRDFSGVRVHSDEPAAMSATAIGARAYTFGDHIVFGRGQYAPARRDGEWLLAHELAHVAQQSDDSSHSRPLGPGPIRRADEGELAFLDNWVADKAASEVLGETAWHFLRELLRGFTGGIKQNVKEGGIEHVAERLHSLFTSPSALVSFHLHYVEGVAEGLVSPIVDLWHLLSGAVKLSVEINEWMIAKAAEVFRTPDVIVARARAVWARLESIGGQLDKVFEQFRSDPGKAIKQLGDWLDRMMQAALGKARAKGHEIADAIFAFIDLDWGIMGEKIGYVIGAAVVQILLLVFSEGIGNLISEAGAFLGRVGSMVGAEALNLIRAVGGFVTKLLEGVKALGGTVMKLFEGLAADIVKLFEEMKALLELAAEQFKVGELAVAGDAPPEALLSKATRLEPKPTRATTTTVEELTGKGPKGTTKPAPQRGVPERSGPDPDRPHFPPEVEERGKDILEIFEEHQERADPGVIEEEFTGEHGRGERDKPGGGKEPVRYEVGKFSHDYAEELVPELKTRSNLDREFKIPESARRIDRVDWTQGELIEVKPNVSKWMKEGEEQLRLYKMHMDQKFPRPGGWKTKLVTYDRDAVYGFLKRGWPKK